MRSHDRTHYHNTLVEYLAYAWFQFKKKNMTLRVQGETIDWRDKSQARGRARAAVDELRQD